MERSVDGAAEVLRAMILGDAEVVEVVDDENQLVAKDDEGVAKDAEDEELVLSVVVGEESVEDRLQVAQQVKLASGLEQSSGVQPVALSPYSQPATASHLYYFRCSRDSSFISVVY